MVDSRINGVVNRSDRSGPAQRALASDDGESDVPRTARTFAVALAVACFAIALAAPDAILADRSLTLIWPPDLRAWTDWVLQLHWILGLLVIAPFLISAIVVLDLRATWTRSRRLSLIAREPSTAGVPRPHADEDRALWEKRRIAVEMSWEYEKDRIGWLQCRLVLQTLLFGDVTSLALMCSALMWSADPAGSQKMLPIACSVAAAAATAFLANLARIILRISGGDVTTRTFSWAIRSVILVIIADVGLFALLGDAAAGINHALLIGIFVGATGDHAIQFFLDKAAKALNTGPIEAQKASPLLDIESITASHVERLEEEGIVSIHDLAFVPTARLFFATAYSLQQICDWQDRALLLVYVGKRSAQALAEQMNIRGAIDLRAFAHDLLFEPGKPSETDIRESLRKALNLEPGGLAAVLESMAHDEVAMRVRYYWGAVIAPTPRTAGPPEAGAPAPQLVVPPTPQIVVPPAAPATQTAITLAPLTAPASATGTMPPEPRQAALQPDDDG